MRGGEAHEEVGFPCIDPEVYLDGLTLVPSRAICMEDGAGM